MTSKGYLDLSGRHHEVNYILLLVTTDIQFLFGDTEILRVAKPVEQFSLQLFGSRHRSSNM